MELFGHSIDPGGRLSLRDQVRVILEGEIRNWRWRAGERLPTVREMAQAAGLSTSPIHQAVSALVDEGYLEKHVGRGTYVRANKTNARHRNGAVGVVLGEQRPGVEIPTQMAFFQDLIEAATEEFAKRGYVTHVLHARSLSQPDAAKPGQTLSASALPKVDGLLNIRFATEPVIAQTRALHLPLVCLSTIRTPPGVPFVAADDLQSMWDAVDILYRHGHRRIGLIHAFGPGRMPAPVRARFDAFIEATAELGVPARDEWIVDVGPTDNIQVLPIRDLLLRADIPTAVICTQSLVAKAVYDVAALSGKRVGSDLSLLAMTEDIEFGKDFDPPVSALATSAAAMARQAVELLIGILQSGRSPEIGGILVRPTWIPRQSIATLAARIP